MFLQFYLVDNLEITKFASSKLRSNETINHYADN